MFNRIHEFLPKYYLIKYKYNIKFGIMGKNLFQIDIINLSYRYRGKVPGKT